MEAEEAAPLGATRLGPRSTRRGKLPISAGRPFPPEMKLLPLPLPQLLLLLPPPPTPAALLPFLPLEGAALSAPEGRRRPSRTGADFCFEIRLLAFLLLHLFERKKSKKIYDKKN